jgi:TolB protein
MTHRLRLPVLTLLAAALLLPGLVPSRAAAQEPREPPAPQGAEESEQAPGEVTLVLEEGQRPLLRLAFPELETRGRLTAAGREAADELEETLRADLEAARIFEIQGPWAFTVLELTGELSRDMELYRSLGNEILLLGDVSEEAGKLTFEGRVFDLASGSLVLGKRYRGDFDVARRIAHTFADEVILYFTGRRGLGLTTLTFYSDRTGDKEIWLMDYDGANQRRITAHRSVSLFPTWTADDAGVAYVSYLDGAPGIYEADLATGRKRPLVTGTAFNTSPTFSPDGRRMAFARSLEGNTEIFVASADGSGPRRLTYTGAIDTNAAWSPSGGEIAFTSSRSGRPDIWVVDPEGSNTQRVSTGGEYNDGAAWSPDGTRIAYASRRGGVFQIAVTDRVTLQTTVLTSGGGDKEAPTFSPDGRKIAYTLAFGGREGKRTHIWVMDADGRNPTQLTTEGNNHSPDWSGYRE